MINLGFSAQVSKLTTTATAPGTLACISIYPSRPPGEKWRRGPRHPSLTIRLTFIRPSGALLLPSLRRRRRRMCSLWRRRPKKSQNGRRVAARSPALLVGVRWINKLGKRRSFILILAKYAAHSLARRLIDAGGRAGADPSWGRIIFISGAVSRSSENP